jgi:hypothetical protein
MKTFLSGTTFASLALTCFLFAACKPNEPKPEIQPPAPALPVVTNQNAAPVPTNAVETATAISPAEAKNHIGEMVTVKGQVVSVHVSKKGDVFLDLGGKYPNAPFTAVCFKEAIPTADLKALQGKTVSITGKVKDYQGRIEIILDTAAQISQ